MSAARELHWFLEGLLAATPEPPIDADPADLLLCAETMMSARGPLLDALRAQVAAAPIDGALAETFVRLQGREQAWEAALDGARKETLRRLAATRRLGRR